MRAKPRASQTEKRGLIAITDHPVDALYRLSRLYGVDVDFYRHSCADQEYPESLVLTLRAMGAPLVTLVDAPHALREQRQERWRRFSEPVVVAWERRPAVLDLRVPAMRSMRSLECELESDSGTVLDLSFALDHLPVIDRATVEGVDYELRRLTLPSGLPWGYHRLRFNLPTRQREVLVISAPARAYAPPAGYGHRRWGVFLPLYALHSAGSWGAGDYSDMDAVMRWLGSLGGSFFGTLPLLPTFLDWPFDPSPYAPVSRLMWSEFYLAVPEAGDSERESALARFLDSPETRAEIRELQDMPLVDYRRVMRLKRRALETAAEIFFRDGAGQNIAFQLWQGENPWVRDYARFRATMEQRHERWQLWPERLRDGQLQEGDWDPAAERYHLYTQWLAQRQVEDFAVRAREKGQRLYLDLPLGVHTASYDVWREREAFALGASTGAPPDALCAGGQDWGFAPLHPERIREQGYHYFIACLRHHLRYAGVLRVDHVAGFHRLFWIPRGLPASQGVYVHYRPEEFYAILTLESQRHQAMIVGEDLGLVPPYVRTMMARRRVFGMYVLPFKLKDDPQDALKPVPAASLTCLNTHDTVPFASFWSEREPGEQERLSRYFYRNGLLRMPVTSPRAALRGCLFHLAGSRSRFLQVSLEDLWLEEESQNIPGTVDEYPNWRRKARYSIEEFSANGEVLSILRNIRAIRQMPPKTSSGCGQKEAGEGEQ